MVVLRVDRVALDSDASPMSHGSFQRRTRRFVQRGEINENPWNSRVE
jgi:hypothetical protein